MSGLTPTGFRPARLQDIRDAIDTRLDEAFGPEFARGADSPTGQLKDITSKGLADVWELAEAVWYARYPDSASGPSLDAVVALVDMERLGADDDTVLARCVGTAGVTLPAGVEISDATGQHVFASNDPIPLTLIPALTRRIRVFRRYPHSTYSITVNGSTTAHATGSSWPPPSTIPQALYSSASGHPDVVGLGATAHTFTLIATDPADPPLVTVHASVPNLHRFALNKSIAPGVVYSLKLDGQLYSVTAGAGDTVVGMNQQLASMVNTSPSAVTARASGAILEMVNTPGPLFTAFAGSNMFRLVKPPAIIRVYNIYGVRGVGQGVFSRSYLSNSPMLPSGAIQTIVTSTPGWDAVASTQPVVVGAAGESDTQLRRRRRQTLSQADASVVEAIERVIANVPSVTWSAVVENAFDIPDAEGRPPHSFEAIVQGGLDSAIAEALWRCKPAGIATVHAVGTGVSRVIHDSQGNPQTVAFSRPTVRPVHVRVSWTAHPEEGQPDTWEDAAAIEISAYFSGLGIGEDVVVTQILAALHRVPGFYHLQVELFDGAWTPNNVAIGVAERATFDPSHLTFVP